MFSYGNRKTSAGVWSGKEMQRLQLHSPTYNAINRCSNASSLYVWVHIRMSWWPTMNRRNEISVQMAHYLTPVEISGAWQRCGLMGVRRLNLDLHNHRYRTASSLSRARSWGRTCFHNWGRLFTAAKGPRLKKQLSNKHVPVTQHNTTQPGGSTSVDEISTRAAATILRRAITETVQWRAGVTGSLYPTAFVFKFLRVVYDKCE